MKAYEFPATVTPDGDLKLPKAAGEMLPINQVVRVIVLVSESSPYETHISPEEENSIWTQYAGEHLLKQFSEADEIYDQLET